MSEMGIYLLSVSEAEKLDGEICEALFPKRMERARRLKNREDCLRCIAAGALLAAVVGVREDETVHNEWGKPLIAAGCPNVSLSHSGDYALLAVSDEGISVGADIEMIHSAFRKRVAERLFSEEESAWMNEKTSGDPDGDTHDVRFYKLWTMKESLGKLSGKGLSLVASSLSVLPLLTGKSLDTEWGTIFGSSAVYGNYAISVCSANPPEKIVPTVLTAEDILNKTACLTSEQNNKIYYTDSHIKIRNMLPSDTRVITEEEVAQGWIHQTEDKYLMRLEHMAAGKCTSLVAEYDGFPAGYINVYPNCEGGAFGGKGLPEIVDFGVLAKYRRRGIGSKLMDVAEEIAGRYSDTVCIGVGLHSGYGSAQRMYVKRGYIPDGSGVWYNDEICPEYAPCSNDDSLILYLSKKLR